MSWRAAKHIARSCSEPAASGAPLSPAKLSPATNNSTGRGDASLESPVATSSTLRSLSPYFSFRENDTPAHGFDGSGAAPADLSSADLSSADLSPVDLSSTASASTGAASAGAASAGAASKPSRASPALTR